MQRPVTTHQVLYGSPILPVKRIQIFSPDEWEIFIEEWLDIKKVEYVETERLGGAGDKGRDVVAYITDKKKTDYQWDCYQCKHYDEPLMPSQILVEIGKVLYFSYNKDYPKPRAYYFVAPKGCGTSLSKLLQNSNLLKSKIVEEWNDKCRDKISVSKVDLDGDFLTYVNVFDFSIFSKIEPKKLIEEHSKHPNHIVWFGGGLPARQEFDVNEVPESIQDLESIYISQLLKAYSSDLGVEILNISSLIPNSSHDNHLKRARISFHHAEQLRNFTRDNLPVGTFKKLQEDIFDGVINICDDDINGFKKVKAIENQATTLSLTSSPLRDVIYTKDKHGICHQLCNEERLKWIK